MMSSRRRLDVAWVSMLALRKGLPALSGMHMGVATRIDGRECARIVSFVVEMKRRRYRRGGFADGRGDNRPASNGRNRKCR